MDIVVCVKQIMDPEVPPAKFQVDSKAMKVVPPEGIPPVISPYDGNAMELALQLKEKNGGKVTVLSIGEGTVADAVKHTLAMGAEEGFILQDDAFQGSDSYSIATILTKAIQKIGKFDVVLFGRQAADWDEGLVGAIVAENLGLPLVTQVKAVAMEGGGLHCTKATLEGTQVFEAAMPAAITVGSEVGKPRLPSGMGIIKAAKKQIPIWKAADLGLDAGQVGKAAARRKLVKLFIPEKGRSCEIITGGTPEEAAVALANRLREAGAL